MDGGEKVAAQPMVPLYPVRDAKTSLLDARERHDGEE